MSTQQDGSFDLRLFRLERESKLLHQITEKVSDPHLVMKLAKKLKRGVEKLLKFAEEQKIDPSYLKSRLEVICDRIDEALVWAMSKTVRAWWQKVIDVLLLIISLIASVVTITPVARQAVSSISR